MAFCTSCGCPLNDGAKFCTGCGAPVPAAAGEETPVMTESVEEIVPAQNAYAENRAVDTPVSPVYEQPVNQCGSCEDDGGFTPKSFLLISAAAFGAVLLISAVLTFVAV